MRGERAMLEWIPGKDRLCAVNDSRLKRRCFFVILLYAPTDCSSRGLRLVIAEAISIALKCAFNGRFARCG